jgi:hypothetical protein
MQPVAKMAMKVIQYGFVIGFVFMEKVVVIKPIKLARKHLVKCAVFNTIGFIRRSLALQEMKLESDTMHPSVASHTNCSLYFY